MIDTKVRESFNTDKFQECISLEWWNISINDLNKAIAHFTGLILYIINDRNSFAMDSSKISAYKEDVKVVFDKLKQPIIEEINKVLLTEKIHEQDSANKTETLHSPMEDLNNENQKIDISSELENLKWQIKRLLSPNAYTMQRAPDFSILTHDELSAFWESIGIQKPTSNPTISKPSFFEQLKKL